ncbi:MAG: hypothetical protein ACE5IQ_09985 [Candidatus Methylomirabilales bacterium]
MNRSKSFMVSVKILILAFLADTASTLAAGPDMLAYDLNPMVHRLSVDGYVAWSVIRLMIAVSLLTLYWPGLLVIREWIAQRGRWIALILPFSYRAVGSYIVAALIIAIGPLKLVAACSNLVLLTTGRRLLQEEITIGLGILLGLLTANILLLCHHTLLSQPERVS